MILLTLSVAAVLLALISLRDRHALSKSNLALRLGASVLLVLGGLFSLENLYLLGKLLGRLAMPTGLVWLLLWALIFKALWEKQRKAVLVFSGILVAYTLAGNVWLGGVLTGTLEAEWMDVVAQEHEPFEAVLVLGGGATGDSEYAQVNDAGDRVVLGARLYNRGLTPVLVTSGSSIPGLGSYVDVSEATTAIWTELAVPESAIVRMPEPKNTREEIAGIKELMKEKGWTRVGLVTSAWHMRRAMKLAKDQDVKLHPLPADFRTRTGWDGILSIVPDAHGFINVQRACWEYLGAATGR